MLRAYENKQEQQQKKSHWMQQCCCTGSHEISKAAITVKLSITDFKLLLMKKKACFRVPLPDTTPWKVHQNNWAISIYELPGLHFSLNDRITDVYHGHFKALVVCPALGQSSLCQIM